MVSRLEQMRQLLVATDQPKQDVATAAAVLLMTEGNAVIKESEAVATPITAWIRERKELAWFVDYKRVALEGKKTWEELKKEYPAASRDELLSMSLAVWLRQLRTFAEENGYARQVTQEPLKDEEFE